MVAEIYDADDDVMIDVVKLNEFKSINQIMKKIAENRELYENAGEVMPEVYVNIYCKCGDRCGGERLELSAYELNEALAVAASHYCEKP